MSIPTINRVHIGVFMRMNTSFGRGVFDGIASYVSETMDWQTYFLHTDVQDIGECLSRWRGDGILCGARHFTDPSIQALDIPVVAVSADRLGPDAACVGGNDAEVGRIGARYFLRKGYKNLAYSGQPSSEFSNARLAAYQEYAAEHGASVYTCPSDEEFVKLSWADQLDAMGDWLSSIPKPFGLLTHDDLRAHRLCQGALHAGLRLPGDMALLGTGNDAAMCNFSSPTISSIDINIERRGYEAARLLDQMLRGEATTARHVTVDPVGVVSRQSTNMYAISDPDVIDALRFIEDHAHQPISVSDVAQAVALSRRTLDKRFARYVGQSVLHHIRDAHIRRAQNLLRTSDQNTLQIALNSGFTSASALSQVFRERLDTTPSAYRSEHRAS